jgi:hypothetical protein
LKRSGHLRHRTSHSCDTHNNIFSQSALVVDSFVNRLVHVDGVKRAVSKNQRFTMKRVLIGSLLFAVLASSAPAFAQSSNAAPRTRAEVKAELVAARNSGELDAIHSESYPQLLPYQTSRASHVTSSNGTRP